jgi:thiol-disulfide isomerase/thioredoxin
VSSQKLWPDNYLGNLTGDFNDFLPHYPLLPELTTEEVELFVKLGEAGRERFNTGDLPRAEAAFRGQIAIYPPNYEPFVALALLEASRRNKKEAVAHLRAAVVRGFTDIRRIRKAEAWTVMRRNGAFLTLTEVIPVLNGVEKESEAWNRYNFISRANNLAVILERQDAQSARITSMAPALGPRLTRLWNLAIQRASAAAQEQYIRQHPDAPDLEAAVGSLIAIYEGGPLNSWLRLSPGTGRRLAATARIMLEKFPHSSHRPVALVGLAMGRNAQRDRKGNLSPGALKEITTSLEEVIGAGSGSPVVATAAVGLILLAEEAGERERARSVVRQFFDGDDIDPDLQSQIRQGLGNLALRLGGVPDFEIGSLGGENFTSDQLRGKVVVIDFWATWCPPCLDGFPSLRKIAGRHGEQVLVVGVNMDYSEDYSPGELREWITREKVPGLQLYDGLSWESKLVRDFGVQEIPFTVVIDPEGSVVAVNAHGKKLEKVVSSVVRGKLSASR